MDSVYFKNRFTLITDKYNNVINRKNSIDTTWYNGIFDRYKFPVLTDEHTPIFWRYDLNKTTNPYLMERMGINGVFNAGAIEMNGKTFLICRVEGSDRKSFFAVAESENGIDSFKFWDYPIVMPMTEIPDTNVYDMRVIRHEDGFIYGLFCTERKDPKAGNGDTSSAVAACGIARTKDLVNWERLEDLKSDSAQQRNVVLHPEFIDGKYALYTRPQDDFIQAGNGGGIGFALCDSMEHAVIHEEKIVDSRIYHTIKEVKNGQGPAPIKTEKGWLNIAHGVRNTAAGLRYVIYAFLSDINNPEKVIHSPAGYLIAPYGLERIGDVSNVVFCNGAVVKDNGDLLIYYASSDTRMHVAVTTVDKMLDYVINTPEDPLTSYECVKQRYDLISKNLEYIKSNQG